MKQIPEETVDDTWQDMSGYTEEEMFRQMGELGDDQPHLLAFISQFTQDLNEAAEGLTIYLFFVVYRMFRSTYGGDMPTVSPDEVIEAYEYNEKVLEGLENASGDFWTATAREEMASQPHVVRYVVEALFEAPEDDELKDELSEEEEGYIFLLLKTVIDALDKKTEE
jgi:hypothetical protein